MEPKQKSAWLWRVAATMFFGGILVLLWSFGYRWATGWTKLPQPIVRTSVVLAQAPPADTPNQIDVTQELANQWQTVIDDFIDTHGDYYSIYIEHIDSQAAASHDAQRIMNSASLYKLFAANEALKMVDDGQLQLTATIDPSRNLDVRDCLKIMIIVSDNGCGVIFQRSIGASSHNLPQLKRQHLPQTNLSGYYPQTSARDVAQMLRNLLKSDYLSRDSQQLLLGYLANQQINNRLPQKLPDDVDVWHKTADLDGYAHDAGIVKMTDPTNDYVVVLMSRPGATSDYSSRYQVMAELSRRLYEVVSGFGEAGG